MRTRSVVKLRVCLRCGRRFLSLSPANRICPGCKAVQYGTYADAIRLEQDERRNLTIHGINQTAG